MITRVDSDALPDSRALLLEPVKSSEKPLPEKVADLVTRLIIEESYLSGHKLPNEYVLAERLGVGRSTVREAVKLLVSRNVLEVRHGSGTFVRDGIGIVDDPLGFRFRRDKKALALELCEIRLMVEPPIAAAAAGHATPAQICEMERLCGMIEKVCMAEAEHCDADALLHKTIAESSGNRVAPGIVGIIVTAIPLLFQITRRTQQKETIRIRRRVVEAIGRHNARAAKKAMQELIEHNRNCFLALPE